MDLDTTWLIAGLLALALIALSLAAAGWRRSRRRRPTPGVLPRDKDLQMLGLSEARPVAAPPPKPAQAEDGPAADARLGTAEDDEVEPEDDVIETPPDEPAEPEDDAMDSPDLEMDPAVRFDDAGVSAPRPVPRPPEAHPAPRPQLADASPLWRQAGPAAVGPLLESLRALLGAQSVALLRHAEAEDTFVVEALVSRDAAVRTEPFPARGSALRRVVDGAAIAVLEGEALAALRYHVSPRTAVGHAAALALPEAPRLLLVADGGPDQPPFSDHHLQRLGDYADLLGRLFLGTDADEAAPDVIEAPTPPAVRPRADIIAEEMAAARIHERPLALALVVRQDSEEVAADGPEAVAEAEEQLFARLRAVEGSARVDRFGEGMAGVFCHAGPAFVEAWAERVGAAGPPVFIGVALLRARHADAEAFRADAAAALHEAYQRGETCVILE